MDELRELTRILDGRFAEHLRHLDGETPSHKVEFSSRITNSWALIYYRRRLVRLSPYLFLLPAEDLHHDSHWQELDATLRHEAAHAATFARTGAIGHTPLFHAHLHRLGVKANGDCDLGPENVAFRYVYACSTCAHEWPRRLPLHGNWSCGECAPGRYASEHRMLLKASLAPPSTRLREHRERVRAALDEGFAAAGRPVAPLPRAR